MNQNIKEFLQQGEKEFEEKFDAIDINWLKQVLDWHSSRQISLIKMIVEEIEKGVEEYKVPKEAVIINKLGADYIFIYDFETFISSNLKDLIK